MLKFSALVFCSVLSISAHAKLELLPNLSAMNAGDIRDYRLGDEWGKLKVTPETLNVESHAYVRAAEATAYLPVGGTGFYLGKFNGKHILATNHHVCPVAQDCVGDQASFKLLKKKFKMTKLLITKSNIDLALLEISVPKEDEAGLKKIAKNFSFDQDLKKGQELLTIGYGIGGNSNNNMMANQDSDCKVFSKDGEYKFFADPDEFNPGGYKAWSFAHACDISHGDSGSAMIDRQTGDVVGIVWTGKIPKARSVQNSNHLDIIFGASAPDVWKELSYAVPARKIGEYLRDLSNDSSIEIGTQKIFKAMTK